MTKHLEIWTLSKESRVVPYMADFIDLYEYYPPPDVYVWSHDVLVDKVERRYMNIVKVSKSEAIYDRMEMDSLIERSDKYIAIHPDVEEAISVKYRAEIGELNGIVEKLTEQMINFSCLPWYKRVWRSLLNKYKEYK